MNDIIIIGAGIAGLTSAIYARRSNHSVIVFDKNFYGGQIVLTNVIENYPGIPVISGVELAMSVYNQATALGADIKFEDITEINLDGDIKSIVTPSGKYEAKAVIIATGAERRRLGCAGEEKFAMKGVSYCAICDGALYKEKDVAVVGGGNTALEDAVFLSNICSRVYLIHRRDTFRGDKILVDSVKSRENIEIIYSSTVQEICGEASVSSLKIAGGDALREISVKAVFIAVGLEPKNQVFTQLPLDKYGYIIAGEDCATQISGVYAAGDTRTKILRQLVTAAADGAVSAFQAGNYINSIKTENAVVNK